MLTRPLTIAGLVEITPTRFQDPRGYFSEVFRSDLFRSTVAPVDFVQENQSLSVSAGVVRGLHYQTPPMAQGKLVRCLQGSIFDVAVDIRQGSPTYGHWEALTLSAEVGNQLWVPAGFLHGFCTLEPNTIVNYKVTAFFSAENDAGVAWNDPSIGVDWPSIADAQTLSRKDQQQPGLADMPAHFMFEEA